MMAFLFAASVLALGVLAILFVAVLAVRLFTKRRPPLCTRRAPPRAAAAQAGLAADDRRYNALIAVAGKSHAVSAEGAG